MAKVCPVRGGARDGLGNEPASFCTVLYCSGPGMVLEWSWNGPGMVLEWWWNCPVMVLEWSWNVLFCAVLYCSGPGMVLEWSWNVLFCTVL